MVADDSVRWNTDAGIRWIGYNVRRTWLDAYTESMRYAGEVAGGAWVDGDPTMVTIAGQFLLGAMDQLSAITKR